MMTRINNAFERQRPARYGARPRAALQARAFTLIEIILVMALIVIAASLVIPHFANFSRGRILSSEARQILSLTRQGQSRAISGGVPMVLWFDTAKQKYGLEEEPGYNDKDPDAVEFPLNENLKLDIPDNGLGTSTPGESDPDTERQGLPKINFLTDGTLSETSPQTIRIADTAGPSISLTQTRDKNGYEISTTENR